MARLTLADAMLCFRRFSKVVMPIYLVVSADQSWMRASWEGRGHTSEPMTSLTRWEASDIAPSGREEGFISVGSGPAPEAVPSAGAVEVPGLGPLAEPAAPFSGGGLGMLRGKAMAGSSWSGCEGDGLSTEVRPKSAMVDVGMGMGLSVGVGVGVDVGWLGWIRSGWARRVCHVGLGGQVTTDRVSKAMSVSHEEPIHLIRWQEGDCETC